MPEENQTTNLLSVDRRMERRTLFHVPVEVTKLDGEGPRISERSYIEDLSDFGCRFTARGTVQRDETVALRFLRPRGNVVPGEDARYYEIMWVAQKGNGSTVGARLLHGEKLANVQFPPANGGPNRDAK